MPAEGWGEFVLVLLRKEVGEERNVFVGWIGLDGLGLEGTEHRAFIVWVFRLLMLCV